MFRGTWMPHFENAHIKVYLDVGAAFSRDEVESIEHVAAESRSHKKKQRFFH